MIEYLVFPLSQHQSKYTAKGLSNKLTELAKDGWSVVTSCELGIILVRDVRENKIAEVIERVTSHSWLEVPTN
jgi:hypothetical protein